MSGNRNPAYDGPMGIFEGYGEYDEPAQKDRTKGVWDITIKGTLDGQDYTGMQSKPTLAQALLTHRTMVLEFHDSGGELISATMEKG